MNSSPDPFEPLLRLLACKRHEQPPPGYFDSFSRKVIVRLEADDLSEHSTWWEWIVARFDAKPVLACAYGIAISGLLLTGFRLSQVFENELAATQLMSGPVLAATPDPNTVVPGEFLQTHFAHPAGLVSMSSINPVLRSEAPAFHLMGGGFKAQPVSFSTTDF